MTVFTCPWCPITTKTLYGLRVHVKTIHKDKIIDKRKAVAILVRTMKSIVLTANEKKKEELLKASFSVSHNNSLTGKRAKAIAYFFCSSKDARKMLDEAFKLRVNYGRPNGSSNNGEKIRELKKQIENGGKVKTDLFTLVELLNSEKDSTTARKVREAIKAERYKLT